jgi:hypothetical protein
MNPPRIPKIFVAVGAMLLLWIGLDVAQRILGQSSATSFFFINLAKVLLIAGIVICSIAGVIAFALGQRRTDTGEKKHAHGGPIAATIIGVIAFLVAAIGVLDVVEGGGSSGEWSGLGVLFVFVISIPGAITTLLMALFLKSFSKPMRNTCIALALAAVALALLMPTVQQYKRQQRQKHFDEETQRRIEEMKKEREQNPGKQ